MIHELDEVLRQLLIRELNRHFKVKCIEFAQPTRNWASRASKPALNLFLYDVRENTTLRAPEWQIKRNGDGTATRQRSAVRIDLHYMLTAWTDEHPDDEHRLLTAVLMILLRYPCLPPHPYQDYVEGKATEDKDFWLTTWPESLRDQTVPCPLRVAQQDDLRTPADVWSAMDNEYRPAIACTITLALNPYTPLDDLRLVQTRDLRVGQMDQFDETAEQLALNENAFWLVKGRLRSNKPLGQLHLTVVDQGLTVPIRRDGKFVIRNLKRGDHTLEIAGEGIEAQRRKLIVPAPCYDLDI